jgi:hypothetical protein
MIFQEIMIRAEQEDRTLNGQVLRMLRACLAQEQAAAT